MSRWRAQSSSSSIIRFPINNRGPLVARLFIGKRISLCLRLAVAAGKLRLARSRIVGDRQSGREGDSSARLAGAVRGGGARPGSHRLRAADRRWPRDDRLEPRATTRSPHPALCAGAGGPIATKVASNGSATRNRDSQELLEPHAVGYVSLGRAASQLLGSGQLAMVRIPHRFDNTTQNRLRLRRSTHWIARLSDLPSQVISSERSLRQAPCPCRRGCG